MLPFVKTKTLTAGVVNSVCASQTPTAASGFTINGTLASGGVATLDTQRLVLFTTAANETGHNAVVTGTDESGATISETVALPNVSTVATARSYKTVTAISISVNATGAIQVGTNTTGATPWFPLNLNGAAPINIGMVGILVSGAVTFSGEYTYDDVTPGATTLPTVLTISALSAKAATTDTAFTQPVRAVRFSITAGTGVLRTIVLQPGI